MKALGILLLLVAAALGAYAMFIFGTTVGGYHNIGLLQTRQNMLLISGVIAVIGTLMAIFGSAGEPATSEGVFRRAIDQGDLAQMERMLDSQVIEANGRTSHGQCWLRYAMNREAVQQCELLLRKGADPTFQDGWGPTVLDSLQEAGGRRSLALTEILRMCEEKRTAGASTKAPEAASVKVPDQVPASDAGGWVEQLTDLGRMREQGLLSPDEFDQAKAQLLSRASAV